MAKFNVIVIGAGAVGSAVARELSKYELSVAVVEKSLDIGGDASRSNSAIIHTGYDASPGSLESQLVVAANPMYPVLTQELDIPFRRVGAILPAVTEEQATSLPAIKHKAFMNHVYDVEYVSRERLLELEPEVNSAAFGGLYIPRESIIDPFLLVVALAENAYDNGVQFFTNTKATAKRKISVTLELIPSADRRTITVQSTAKCSLTPTDPVTMSLYITNAPSTGELLVAEMVPQVPGQLAFDGEEQDHPKILKFKRQA